MKAKFSLLVLVTFGFGLMTGCDNGAAKRQQQAEAQAAAERQAREIAETARAAKAADQLKVRAKDLSDVLDNYGVAVGGLAMNADTAIAGVRMIANSPEGQKLRRLSPQKADEILEKTVVKQYEVFQKGVRAMLEKMDDLGTREKLSTVQSHSEAMGDGTQKTALTTGVAACQKAHQAMQKYRERQRFEVKEKLEQIMGCPKDLAPHIQALKEARTQVQAALGVN